MLLSNSAAKHTNRPIKTLNFAAINIRLENIPAVPSFSLLLFPENHVLLVYLMR